MKKRKIQHETQTFIHSMAYKTTAIDGDGMTFMIMIHNLHFGIEILMV